MFIEFNNEELMKWNSLTSEQKTSAIQNGEVQLATDVSIVIENNGRITEEHKYYQTTTFGNTKLINDIVVSKVKENEVDFSIITYQDNDEPVAITINVNEEKEIEVGFEPFSSIYKINVSNIKYGRIVEL